LQFQRKQRKGGLSFGILLIIFVARPIGKPAVIRVKAG